ncbi:MAG: lipoyl(octanoyl) transferase LipB [Alphaproteobacteria bacterium]|nr:MAG: lipoyl(octanoyl) transferase LipB [Alphaproteobacteria bacterium]
MDAPVAMEWKSSTGLVPYEDALSFMEDRVSALAAGDDADECIWFLEHPPLYTAGTSADDSDLLTKDRFPVYQTGRGGQYTYHGPGQRVAYVMIDLSKRSFDVKKYVFNLEQWIIDSLASQGIKGERRKGRVGIWVDRGTHEDKVAAIGVRISRRITFHGIAINVNPNLEHFSGIIPCGINAHGVTSFEDLGIQASMADLDEALRANLPDFIAEQTALSAGEQADSHAPLHAG